MRYYSLEALAKQTQIPGAGDGDMTKAVYDTNEDGKVNSAASADAVAWSGVSSKPSWASPTGTPDETTFLRGDAAWATPTAEADVSAAWPIGAVFISVVSTNPGTLLGFGTWVAFGAGRMLVGIDSAATPDADFDTVEETGGAKTVTLTEAQIPAHTHVENAPTAASGGAVRFATDTNAAGSTDSTLITGSTGGGEAHSNMPPYIVVYMWKRTA